MFNKKEKIIDTQTDLMLKEKNSKLSDIRFDLKTAVAKVIVTNGVIELYPEGADKEKAKKTAENKKMIMLSLIGKYDDLKNQLNELLKREDRNTTKDWINYTITSHEIVENVYEDFFNKNA